MSEMTITDPMATYLKMRGEVPDIGDEVSDFHDSEVRGMNADFRKKQREWDREHNH